VDGDLKPLEADDGLADARRWLDEDGYCIIPDVLDASTLAALRARVEAQAEAERVLGLTPDLGHEGPNQRVFMLVNKGQVFVDLVTHPLAMSLASHVLGHQFLLSQFSANIARLGGVEQGLHCDDWWSPRPIRMDEPFTRVGDMQRYVEKPDLSVEKGAYLAPPCVVNFAWMVTDFTVENGGTRIAPGSHLTGRTPDGSVPHKVETVAGVGKAGSVLVFDGRSWHGTGRNLTPDPRIALLLTYCGPQFRSQENFFVGLDPKVYAASSETFREVLGFKTWMGYGRTEVAFSNMFVTPQERSFPELGLKDRARGWRKPPNVP
jgi:ectoine hydroxylase-related dioxygenase (phytanoyl-CoA dioxygenase family)